MKKDKKWLREEIKVAELDGLAIKTSYSDYDKYVPLEELNELIDQLEEPEITEDEAWNKIAESLPMSTVELKNSVSNVAFGYKPKEPQQEKPVVPQFVGEQLEYWERNGMNVLYQFFLKEIPSQIIQWLEEDKRNYNKLLDAIKYGHEVEEEKTYRFELNAFHEIDVIASSYDEAQEKADKEWQERFGNLGSFGEVSFREEVEEV